MQSAPVFAVSPLGGFGAVVLVPAVASWFHWPMGQLHLGSLALATVLIFFVLKLSLVVGNLLPRQEDAAAAEAGTDVGVILLQNQEKMLGILQTLPKYARLFADHVETTTQTTEQAAVNIMETLQKITRESETCL
jgi:hypothetical protein